MHPELADHEHLYFESVLSDNDEDFKATYEEAHSRYFSLLDPEDLLSVSLYGARSPDPASETDNQ